MSRSNGAVLGFSRFRRRRSSSTLVDLTPLIDIVFQLLIFFLLTATFQDPSSMDIELARAQNQQKTSEDVAVIMSISETGEFELDSEIVDGRELKLRLCRHADEGNFSLNVRADKSSKHEALVVAMDLAKQCGFKKLGILHQN